MSDRIRKAIEENFAEAYYANFSSMSSSDKHDFLSRQMRRLTNAITGFLGTEAQRLYDEGPPAYMGTGMAIGCLKEEIEKTATESLGGDVDTNE